MFTHSSGSQLLVPVIFITMFDPVTFSTMINASLFPNVDIHAGLIEEMFVVC